MTDLRQAAQQALEALIPLANAASPNERECLTDEDHERAAEALEALCAALAEPEQEPQTTHWEGCEAVHPECRKPDTDCHAQGICQRSGYSIAPTPHREPEQEPVGTARELLTNAALEQLDIRPSTKVYLGAPNPQHDTDCHLQGVCQRSGYSIANTPRRPLTAEEIVDIWAGVSIGYDDEINIIELARAIERKNGITGE